MEEKLNSDFDKELEIIKWKEELLSSNRIGSPCDFRNLNGEKARQWRNDNPNQMNGIPSGEGEIKFVESDFDKDGKLDLLLYFISENCTGHNGGTPSFAKIIYADSSETTHLMEEIRTKILQEYLRKSRNEPLLKEVTDTYLKETTTIRFEGGIVGEFRLYSDKDAHCCPSYTGKYRYFPEEGRIEIEVASTAEN